MRGREGAGFRVFAPEFSTPTTWIRLQFLQISKIDRRLRVWMNREMHLLPILLPTITAFVGSGFGSAVVTHWLTIKRAREELLRAKLEELYLAMNGYCTQVAVSTLPYISAMHGKITYDKANDLFSNSLDPTAPRYFEKALPGTS